MKKVFVLGAGFSRSYSDAMPILASFKSKLIEVKRDSRKYPELSKFADKYYNLSNGSDDFRNIEYLATVILSKTIFISHEEQVQYIQLKHEILKFIQDTISDASEMTEENSKKLTDFLFNVRKCQATLISFNYDLLIEKAVKKSAKTIHIDFAGLSEYPSHNPRFHNSTPIEYIKLHGSLNWYKIKGADSTSLDSVRIVNPFDPFYGIHKNDVPVYIPMTHAKDAFLTGSLYNTLWARAMVKLSSASEIYFIGYGFPRTDSNHFVTFLDLKDKIKAIVVYDQNEEADLKKIFGEEVVVNSDAKAFLSNHFYDPLDMLSN